MGSPTIGQGAVEGRSEAFGGGTDPPAERCGDAHALGQHQGGHEKNFCGCGLNYPRSGGCLAYS